MLTRFWNNTDGGILSTELVLIGTLVAAGVLSGIKALSGNISSELSELGQVVESVSELERIENAAESTANAVPNGIEITGPGFLD